LNLLEKKQKTLAEENLFLKLQITKKDSLSNIDELAKDLNFERIAKIQYIKASKGPVAAR
jgi:hypothetical protein